MINFVEFYFYSTREVQGEQRKEKVLPISVVGQAMDSWLLHAAALGGHCDAIKLLIEGGADINAAEFQSGVSAAMLATQKGHCDVIRVLIEGGADINAADPRFGQTPVMIAAEEGRCDVIKILIDSGADIDAADSQSGHTAVMFAAEEGHSDVIKVLIERGANINAADSQSGHTAAMFAAVEGHSDVIRMLIEGGADVNAADFQSGQTALMLAAHQNHCDVIRMLIEGGADINAADSQSGRTAVMLAAEEGHSDVIKILIEGGADINAADSQSSRTALMLAAVKGHSDVINILIEGGADINAADSQSGSTALMLAAHRNHCDVIRMLIEGGADINAADSQGGRTAAMFAAYKGRFDATKILIESGADINAADSQFAYTVLMFAAEQGHCDVVKMLLESNADINAANSQTGRTAVMLAAAGDQCDVIRILSEGGADINAADSRSGQTALMIAAAQSNSNIIKILIECGADINAADSQSGQTALMFAAAEGDYAVIKMLIELGADINAADSRSGRTALMHAAAQGRCDVIKMLIEVGADINAVAPRSKASALLIAVAQNHCDVIKMLIECGADMNAVNSQFARIAALVAAARNHCDSIKLENATDINDAYALFTLMARSLGKPVGLSIKRVNIEGQLPNGVEDAEGGNDVAFRHNQMNDGNAIFVRLIQLFAPFRKAIKKAADDVSTANILYTEAQQGKILKRIVLFKAAGEVDFEAIRRLVNEGADINFPDLRGITVLHYVLSNDFFRHAKHSKAELVEFLCQLGADANFESKKTISPFSLALERRELDCLKVLIHHGADVRTFKGIWTPLMFFVDSGDITMVREIIDQQELDRTDKNGKTALTISCCNGNLELTKLLIEKNAKADFVNHFGFTCIDYAEYFRHANVVSFFEETSNLRVDNIHTFGLAAMFGDLGRMKEILITSSSIIKMMNRKGKSHLILAAMNGHLDVVKYLVESGCEINAQDEDKETALTAAAKRSHSNIIEFLLYKNANSTLQDKHSKIAIEYSFEKCSREAIDHFIRFTEDWKKETAEGKTVLHYAAENCWISTLSLLSYKQGEVKKWAYKKDRQGHTALSLCRLNENEYLTYKNVINPDNKVFKITVNELTKGLLTAQKKINADHFNFEDRGLYGMTPLHVACYSKGEINFKLLAFLCDSDNSTVQSKDIFERTPLHIACLVDNDEAVRKILCKLKPEQLVDYICAIDFDGNTCLHNTCLFGNLKSFNLIINKCNDTKCLQEIQNNLKNFVEELVIATHTNNYPELMNRIFEIFSINLAKDSEHEFEQFLEYRVLKDHTKCSKFETTDILIERLIKIIPELNKTKDITLFDLACENKDPKLLKSLLFYQNSMERLSCKIAKKHDHSYIHQTIREPINNLHCDIILQLIKIFDNIHDEKGLNYFVKLFFPVLEGFDMCSTHSGYFENLTVIDEKNEEGNTVLHVILENKNTRNFQIVFRIVDKMKNVDEINKHGNTPLLLASKLARSAERIELCKQLLHKGAKIQHTNILRETVLHSEYLDDNLFQLFMEHSASCLLPYMWACWKGYDNTKEILVEEAAREYEKQNKYFGIVFCKKKPAVMHQFLENCTHNALTKLLLANECAMVCVLPNFHLKTLKCIGIVWSKCRTFYFDECHDSSDSQFKEKFNDFEKISVKKQRKDLTGWSVFSQMVLSYAGFDVQQMMFLIHQLFLKPANLPIMFKDYLIESRFACTEEEAKKQELLRKNEEAYPIDSSKPLGHAIILNNFDVFGEGRERNGSNADVYNMTVLLTKLGFIVEVWGDLRLSKKEFWGKLSDTAQQHHHANSSAFCFLIMSHGSLEFIEMAEKWNIYICKLIKPFAESELLKGKPKLFFIQSCRRGKIKPPTPSSKLKYSTEDCLVELSTSPYYASFREARNGSIFIQKLVKEIYKSATSSDLTEIMTKVRSSITEIDDSGKNQITESRSHLLKKFYFPSQIYKSKSKLNAD